MKTNKQAEYPMLSILCITYNHAKFIKQTLDSFLMQKTNFSFEVIIHDDASTDGTTEIIRSYAKKYPKIIKPIYEAENRYSQVDYSFIKDMYVNSKSKYIATCEGDDYWTDENKLQKQVDFLKSNTKYNICFHPVDVINEKNEVLLAFPEREYESEFTLRNLIKHNFIQTSSVVYKRRQSYEGMHADAMPGDWYTHLYHADGKDVGYIAENMAAYRKHGGGVWSGSKENLDKFWTRFGYPHLAFFLYVLEMYGRNKEYRELVAKNLGEVASFVIEYSGKGNKIVKYFIANNPEVEGMVMQGMSKLLADLRADKRGRDQLVDELQKAYERKDAEINDIKSSKVWKARNKVARAMGKRV